MNLSNLSAAVLLFAGSISAIAQQAVTPVRQCLKPNSPVGVARGIHPGRVAWSHAPGAATWDGGDTFWFDDRFNNQASYQWLMNETITSVTGKNTPAEAWKAIFRYFNRNHSKGDTGYRKGEKIAIKVNNNNTYSHEDSRDINASPHMLLALLTSLIEDGGVNPEDITVAEPSRFITDALYRKCHDRFPQVRYVDNCGGDGRMKAEYVPDAMHYSGDNGHLARGIATPFTEADYVINMALLKGHVGQGVTLCGKNWYGCMDIHSDWRKNHHNNFDQSRDGTPKYLTFVDFMGHKDLGGKTLLWLVDGLYGSKNVAGEPAPRWNMEPFGGDWPCSLLGSLDPVAIDMVCLDLLTSQFPDMPDADYSDMYLMEAALAGAPSGTIYDPECDGKPLTSLGVAEHWNNATDRMYSRNLSTGNGIELIYRRNESVARQAPMITNISGRHTTSLDGQWKTIVDPFENGYYNYRLQPYDDGYAQDKTYSDRTKLQEYDFETNKQLFVPGDWNTQRPELYYYEGTVWYRKRFDYDLKPGHRLFLHFGAANYETIVWLNGKRLGAHTGGFTPFDFEITDRLADGENSLVVKVDNKRHPEGVPTVNADWWNYGGITRPVSLVDVPLTFIRDYYVQLKKNDRSTIECRVQLEGSGAGQKVSVEIPELGVKKEAVTGSDGAASFSLKARPKLWSPEDPRLYAVKIISTADTVSDEIGFRTLRTEGSRILLNDKEIFCRGISIHEETPYDSGRAYSRDHARTLLTWAKEMGCNFVRLAHYPHNEEMVREAERMGLLVWSEIPVYWTIHWDNPDTYGNAEKQLTDMITRDKNRCNIIIWSIANETPHSDSRLEFLKLLASKARELDNVRLIGAAMEKEEIEPGVMTVNDPLGDVLDIISFNEYVGWYDGDSEKCDRVNWRFSSDKPVFISEFGGGALYGHHGSPKERFTEEYQEDLYRRHIGMLKRIPVLAGTTPWILKDFRSPRRQVPHIQDDFNRKGLISDKGQKKKAYYILRDWYTSMPR